MIVRLFRKVLSADALGAIFVIAALQVFIYGVAQSLRNTDTGPFVVIGLVALGIGFSLGKVQWTGIRSSVLIAALGLILVWILGARLIGPLQILGQAVISKVPEIIPAIRGMQIIDTTGISEAWGTIAQATSAFLERLQIWVTGFRRNVNINDPLVRNVVWVLIIWLCSAWMGWFGSHRKALGAFVPPLAILAMVTSYSEYKTETLWGMVIILFVLMGIWNYRNHTHTWEKSRIDYSDSIRYDNGQAVLAVTLIVGSIAFITPSISWQDILDYIRERQNNEAAEMLGVQEAPAAVKSINTPKPSLPQEHLLTGEVANSEKLIMTVRTGELPPIPVQGPPVDVPRYYWRSTVYDQYYGTGWLTSTTTKQNASAETPLIPGLLNGYRVVHLKVELDDPSGSLYWSGILFSVDAPVTINWRVRPTSDLFADQSALLQSDMFAASSTATAYQADVYVSTATVNDLRTASTEYPEEILDRYTSIPYSVPKRVLNLARSITQGITNPYDKAKTIESYLRMNYPYDLNVPAPPEDSDVADYFLFDLKKGYCDYYATTMVILARANGLPARFVSGFAPGTYDSTKAEYIIRELNAHSWVEIYFPEIGWIEFEPTASIPEIERDEVFDITQSETNEETASNLITQFRLEKILLWSSPALIALALLILYYALIERWLYLRLAPSIAIDRIYQNFYRAGRPLAGEWEYAETSTEFLQKFEQTTSKLIMRSRFKTMLDELKHNAIRLTDLYHSTLFIHHQTNKQDAINAWNAWKRLRTRLSLTRMFIFKNKD
jgi:transglutaminase-like putative cysteine protease